MLSSESLGSDLSWGLELPLEGGDYDRIDMLLEDAARTIPEGVSLIFCALSCFTFLETILYIVDLGMDTPIDARAESFKL